VTPVLNQVLWTLDNETDSDTFERVCIDLLYRTGYSDIVPVGKKKDRGRDAQQDRRRVPIFIAPSGEKTFFQFSLADRWQKKLEDELEKVKRNNHDIDAFLFVTTASVTGTTRDKLAAHVKDTCGWNLEIRDREWLRLQLEEAHPDLAERHLGIKQPQHAPATSIVEMALLAGKQEGAALYNAGQFGPAAVALNNWLSTHPDDAPAWRALASCHYQLRHYGDALTAIHHAATLQPYDIATRRILASILVEKGIDELERASLLRGRDIFDEIAQTSPTAADAYNLANALSALSKIEDARDLYLLAVERDESMPQAWKNLGSAHEQLGNSEDARRCYEKALALDPTLPEALFAVATLQIKDGEHEAGIELLEKVLATDERARTHWSGAWAWLADGQYRAGRPMDALRTLTQALGQFPNNHYMLNLKAHLLDAHWAEDKALTAEAERFFHFRLELAPNDFRAVESLGRMYMHLRREDDAWEILATFFGDASSIAALRALRPLDDDTFRMLRYRRPYQRFRQLQPLEEYVEQLGANGLQLTSDHVRQLDWAFMGPFVHGRREAEETQTRDASAFTTLCEHHAPRIRAAISLWAESISTDILAPPLDAQARAMTAMALSCPMIALLECSRQTGFLGGLFSFAFDAQTMETPNAVTDIPREVIGDVIAALNRRTKVLREDKPASPGEQ
jgi:tetratricopeptide (TPR) repeat protein